MEHVHEQMPWRSTMDSAPELNAFANPMDRVLENSRLLIETEPEAEDRIDASGSDAQGTDASNQVHINSEATPVEPERRYALIAHAAYLRSERRGFFPGGEIEDWLAAEAEIDLLLASR